MGKLDGLLDKWEKQERAPRESCAERLKLRRQLTYMIPETVRTFEVATVYRTTDWSGYWYKINGVELSIDETLDILMRRSPVPAKTVDLRKLAAAKPPREFASVIDHSAPIPTVTVQLELPLFAQVAA